MTREDITRMAREAGYGEAMSDLHAPALERFAALVAAAEREACAKVCYEVFDKTGLWAALQLSDKIRARGKEPMPLFDDWNKDWQK